MHAGQLTTVCYLSKLGWMYLLTDLLFHESVSGPLVAFWFFISKAWNCDYHIWAHPSHALIHTWTLNIRILILLSLPLCSCLGLPLSWYTCIHAHSNTPKHKRGRPQLRQAISLTIQSVFFPMMFPIGTGRRKSNLLPHRAHAVALIWKMISVLLEPINIILVSSVNDTFLPSIVDLTEEEMSVRGLKKGGGGREEGGDESSGASLTTEETFTPQTASWHSLTLLLIHTYT